MEPIDTITARLSQALSNLQALPTEQEPESTWEVVQGALWGADTLLEQASAEVGQLSPKDTADQITAKLYQARSILQVLPVEGQPEADWQIVRGALWGAEALVEQAWRSATLEGQMAA